MPCQEHAWLSGTKVAFGDAAAATSLVSLELDSARWELQAGARLQPSITDISIYSWENEGGWLPSQARSFSRPLGTCLL